MAVAPSVKLLLCLRLLMLSVVVLTQHLHHQQQHVSPFFYLCSFQHESSVDDESNNDVSQVSLSVTIDGNPQFYVPGQLYNGKVCQR